MRRHTRKNAQNTEFLGVNDVFKHSSGFADRPDLILTSDSDVHNEARPIFVLGHQRKRRADHSARLCFVPANGASVTQSNVYFAPTVK